jgi:hypothetical protein
MKSSRRQAAKLQDQSKPSRHNQPGRKTPSTGSFRAVDFFDWQRAPLPSQEFREPQGHRCAPTRPITMIVPFSPDNLID